MFIMSKSTCPCEQIYASATAAGSASTISGDIVTANASATASSAVSYADALSLATKDAKQLANNYAQHDADIIGQTLTIVKARSLIPSTEGITIGSNTAPYSQIYASKGIVLSSNSPGNQVILTSTKNKLFANGAQVYTSSNPQGSAFDPKGTYYGYDALTNSTGKNNTAVGEAALTSNTSGSDNTAFGAYSLCSNTTGSFNTANGKSSLTFNTAGDNNTASGLNSLYSNTTGYENTAIGVNSLKFNTSGIYNTSVGVNSLTQNKTGSNNTALGHFAGVSSGDLTNCTSIGNGAICSSSNHIQLGNDDIETLVCAGEATISGLTLGKGGGSIATNTAIGASALLENTTGYDNTAVGVNSLYSNTTGNENTSMGSYSQQNTTTGNQNASFGVGALQFNTTGLCNTAVGYAALGTNQLVGSNNTALGYGADVSGNDLTNCTSIGNGAICDASDQITLGNSNVATLRCQVTNITSLSDRRDKKDIEDLESSLEFIEQLKPVRFNWNMRDGGKVDVPEIGFIAQDLKQVQLDTGMKIPNLVYDVNPEKLEASYGALLPLLVKSIQELSHENKRLNAKIQELTAKIQ